MFEFIGSINWGRAIFTIRGVIIFLDLVLFAVFVYSFLKELEYRPTFVRNLQAARKRPVLGDPKVREQWLHILEQADRNPPQSYALAIIEADKFTDSILQRIGYPGEHMADRLESLNGAELATLDNLWRAHRLRNELVHTPDFDVSEHDTKHALRSYQKFLTELGVLE
ncbi:MAG: hypothetical protein Q7S84_02225 [bacterium]|nr:hypothetical protein [bacterium]